MTYTVNVAYDDPMSCWCVTVHIEGLTLPIVRYRETLEQALGWVAINFPPLVPKALHREGRAS